MRESLRAEQKRLARDRIADAAAELIVEKGVANLSMPAVAEAAGVSLRTVYNYVESRDALLDLVIEVANERLERAGVVETFGEITELPQAIRHNWPIFAQLGSIGDAWSAIRAERAASAGRSTAGITNVRVTADLRAALASLSDELDDSQLDALTSFVRLMFSSETFYRLRHSGIGPEESSDVAAWAVRVLCEAMALGDVPFPSGSA